MMPAGIQAEQFMVKHEREPCQRHPEVRIIRGKRPGKPFESNARQYMAVSRNIQIVVIDKKTETSYLYENSNNTYDQYEQNIQIGMFDKRIFYHL